MNTMKRMASRVALRYLKANPPSQLDGMDRRAGMNLINKVIQSAKLNGIFHDDHWEPVQRIWSAMTKAGFDWNLEKNWYDKDKEGNPSAKTWTFQVEWKDKAGKTQVAHGRVVASGAGSVKEPLDRYDVVAYVS